MLAPAAQCMLWLQPVGTPAKMTQATASLGRRALRDFLAVAVYLYICFGSLLLYKAMVLRGVEIGFALHGLAAGKAIFLAKFMVLADRLRVGERFRAVTILRAILYKSAATFVVLAALSVLEQAVIAVLRNRPLSSALAPMESHGLGETLATCLIFLLILIPYFAYKELNVALGEGRLIQMLRRRS